MFVDKWILPTISEVLALSELTLANCPNDKVDWAVATQNCVGDMATPVCFTNQRRVEQLKAEAEWEGAIAALAQLLLQSIDLDTPSSTDSNSLPVKGVIIGSQPLPLLSHQQSSLSTWLFTSKQQLQLPPATAMTLSVTQKPSEVAASDSAELILPLLPGDPLSNEKFCLVLTASFSLAIALGEDINGTPAFLFSFDPDLVEQAWRSLRARIVLASPQFPLSSLDALVEQYYPIAPDYRTVTQFSRLLLKHLPKIENPRGDQAETVERRQDNSLSSVSDNQTPTAHSSTRPDVELLQAFAHEVRTPLTTIRTLTRLLLKRRDLVSDVIKRLKIIDHECTEQINRMELLFRAAELETATTKHTSAHLTAMSLAQVLQQSVPRWQESASRRNLTLDVVLPQQMPTVVSDPIMLDQVLTGLIENFTRSLSAGSHIQVQVIPAGDQLKLQLVTQSQCGESDTEQLPVPPVRKSLGQLLMFHPETGNISLNFTATKHLFQAIGGKLIVRQRPHQGEVLTIFLPMEVSRTDFCRWGKGAVNPAN